VIIDDSDPALEGVVVMIQDGNYAFAQQKLLEYTAQNPNGGPGWYNLALVTDAMGDYETALQYYDKAIQVGPQDFYHDARSGCAKRLSQTEALAAEY
jgi:tetratricopeptide (TPR) repeat protein